MNKSFSSSNAEDDTAHTNDSSWVLVYYIGEHKKEQISLLKFTRFSMKLINLTLLLCNAYTRSDSSMEQRFKIKYLNMLIEPKNEAY